MDNQEEKQKNQATSQQTSVPTVLLVEDDRLLVKMYKTKFEKEDYQVLIAYDGQEGLDKALSEKVDIVLLDIMMPRMSGIDFLKKLRQDPKGKDLPVVVLTNLAERMEAEKAINLGAKGYLVKAMYTPGQVVAKVDEYLGRG